MPLELEALLGCHVVLLQQLPLLSKQGVAVGNGCRDGHFVVGILLVHNAIVQQESAVGLRPTPCEDRLTCSEIPLRFWFDARNPKFSTLGFLFVLRACKDPRQHHAKIGMHAWCTSRDPMIKILRV